MGFWVTRLRQFEMSIWRGISLPGDLMFFYNANNHSNNNNICNTDLHSHTRHIHRILRNIHRRSCYCRSRRQVAVAARAQLFCQTSASHSFATDRALPGRRQEEPATMPVVTSRREEPSSLHKRAQLLRQTPDRRDKQSFQSKSSYHRY